MISRSLFALTLAAALAATSHPAAQRATLKILVIAGEDAVNVVQQKTAVAPVVEIRDRNDQPVSGAAVTFAIRSGKAMLSGSRTFTVTTNAAGRAVASGLTPTGTGALKISATAAFQGQATAVTITQTNVMTAAQAAAISGAGGTTAGAGTSGGAAGGGAGGGAGGLSTTALGVVGGAVAGGTVLAANAGDDGSQVESYSGDFSGTMVTVLPGCAFTHFHAGTIRMTLTDGSNDVVSGDATVDATQTLTSVTGCLTPPPSGLNRYGCCDPAPAVTGSTSALEFTGIQPGNIGTTWIYHFQGALSGDTITGTFTLTIRFPGPPPTDATMSSPVTLR